MSHHISNNSDNQVNLNNSTLTTHTQQLASTHSSGLKDLIDDNTTLATTNGSNIDGIKNNTLSSNLKTAVDTNTVERGNNATNITGILNNNIASTLKSAVDANTSGRGSNSSNITGILNNSIASTLKSAVDGNTSGVGVNSANITNILNNTISSTLKTAVDSIPNKLNNNADDTIAGDLTIYKTGDDNHLNVLSDANNRARINICGNGSIQGSGILYVGQGKSSNSTGTFGGYMCYLGDTTPADIGTSASSSNLGLQDYITFGATSNGNNRAVFYYNNANSGSNYADMYYLGDQYIFNSANLFLTGGDVIIRNSSFTEKGRVHCSNTIQGNLGGDAGWSPTGTGTTAKTMLENTNGEGAGICVSSDATCIWNADNGVYFVDEDQINSQTYAGFYANLTTSGTISTSDERLKTNIQDLSFNRNILDIVNDIPVKTYFDKCMYDISGNEERYEKNKHKYTTLRLGTLAQSMPPEVADLLVKDDEGQFPDKHYSVNYDRLVMFCIEAIKELKKEIDILKSQ